jgi:hypothetical protein
MIHTPTTRAASTTRWSLLLLPLALARLPSLAEPVGNDQYLYLYVADRLLEGGVPYLDAWDQKPPAVYFIYALLRAIWPHASVVAMADLAAAGLTAWALVRLGGRTFGSGVGVGAAVLLLLFGHPSLARLSGVYVRGQCEVFIATAIAVALLLLVSPERTRWRCGAAGVAFGAAVWLKYNAFAYALPVFLAGWLLPENRATQNRRTDLVWIGGGFLLVTGVVVTYFQLHGALVELRLATIDYNLQYSGETYNSGLLGALSYSLALPFQRARVDMLWYLGGLGALALALTVRLNRAISVITLAWLVAVMISIAVNGSRGLPQYFVQAGPALAFAAAAGLSSLWGRGTVARVVVSLLVVMGVWKVGVETPSFAGLRWGGMPQLVDNLAFDVQYMTGEVDRRQFLERFKGEQKYDALAVLDLAQRIQDTTEPQDRIFVFGFAPGVYVESGRRSASRFFWSRPVILEFAANRPGYGSRAMLRDLRAGAPAVVALQKRDWDPDVTNSGTFFEQTDALWSWLVQHYVLEQDTAMFSVWRRRS